MNGDEENDGDTQEFELQQPTGSSAVSEDAKSWARLVSVDKLFPNIEITGNDVALGRSQVTKVNGDKDLRVSSCHCRISRDDVTGICSILNTSRNGTFVQGKLLQSNQQSTLHQGDEIAFGHVSSGFPVFVFQIRCGVPVQQQKRKREQDDEGAIKADSPAYGEEHSDKELKILKSLETFKCSICLSLLHDVVALSPCLHSFCNSCFSDWFRASQSASCKCPQCRIVVSTVSRNHVLHGLIEEFLKDNPSLARSEEDMSKMDKNSLFSALTTISPGNLEEYDEAEDSDEGELPERCFQCPAYRRHPGIQSSSEFRCCQNQSHWHCNSCAGLFPLRPHIAIPQRCAVCIQPYCSAYWISQGFSELFFCSVKLKQMSERMPVDIPRGAFNYNLTEQEITRQYLADQGCSLAEVVGTWMTKLDSDDREQHWCSYPINSSSALCDSCADNVVSLICYKFRLTIPKTELPLHVAQRQDCWYGHECRTQTHRHTHAQKYNHACEPRGRS